MNQLRQFMTLLLTMAIFSLLPEQIFAFSKSILPNSNLSLLGQVSSGPSVNYVFEIGIVVLLFGGALFAICKTSYRR